MFVGIDALPKNVGGLGGTHCGAGEQASGEKAEECFFHGDVSLGRVLISVVHQVTLVQQHYSGSETLFESGQCIIARIIHY